ncbi:isochorismatase family cysteine hydrolase [Phenylobacterium sp.]|uniref:isochorismatase family cysteine hydrolase n=1 Tax=Phenylobacterium sp. TaxID=1871053 RepID=UPI00273021E8|nr:isochorismatase family cysteine hydrolase [Phenylobacterium sp.]MDP1616801.1 isochorismatase family cysteine hydrolase [Phenylobacterium sp.]MDP1986272.1 isochorismatase family cysteine hydrolase [Phenylobacterium sp.]
MAHNWMIAEREYLRQESRRGRRHAYEHLNPTTTALVVIDMVPFFAEANIHCRDAITPINRLAAALREGDGVVAWVLPADAGAPSPHAIEFYGAQIAQTYGASGGQGAPRDRLCPELAVMEGDVFAEKSAASAFFPGRCDLHDRLAARGIETVIIAGTVTNVCCESSARDASTLGYRVIFAADATATVTDAAHNAALYTIYRSFGDVRPTAEILDLIAGSPARAAPAHG